MKGNKGEWSELYAFLKLAADGKLYAADKDMKKRTDIYYDILKIIREQGKDKFNYLIDGYIRIFSSNNNEEITAIPIRDFKENAEKLLQAIKNAPKACGSFEVPGINNFVNTIKCTTIKAKSTNKADIILVVHDAQTGTQPTLGFSIKSQLGSPATLLNASNATNFIYRIYNHRLNKTEISDIHNMRYFREKFQYLDALEAHISFMKVDNEIFDANLMLIDTQMPLILSGMLEDFYRGTANTIVDLTRLCIKKNICNIGNKHKPIFYMHKIKDFLTSIALGMMPSALWEGNYAATGGYIIVKEDGDVLCYHIYNRNDFREYLYHTTRFETPSMTKHHFGTVDIIGEQQIIKLNLQIRFIK